MVFILYCPSVDFQRILHFEPLNHVAFHIPFKRLSYVTTKDQTLLEDLPSQRGSNGK